MRSGCGSPHRGQSPSSVTQLPILTALHARSPTLFFLIIHEIGSNVNPYFQIFHWYWKKTEIVKECSIVERVKTQGDMVGIWLF